MGKKRPFNRYDEHARIARINMLEFFLASCYLRGETYDMRV